MTGRKFPCSIEDSNPLQYCDWLLSRTLCQPSYLHRSLYENKNWMAKAKRLPAWRFCCTFPVCGFIDHCQVGCERNTEWQLPRHRTQLATMVHYVQYSYLSWRRGKKSVTVWDSRTFALSTAAYKEARRPVMPPFAFYLKGSLFLPHCRIGGRRLKWVLDDSNKLRQVVQLAEFAQSCFVSHFVQSQ